MFSVELRWVLASSEGKPCAGPDRPPFDIPPIPDSPAASLDSWRARAQLALWPAQAGVGVIVIALWAHGRSQAIPARFDAFPAVAATITLATIAATIPPPRA